MVGGRIRGKAKHPTQLEADLLAREFIETLQQITLSGKQHTREEVASLVRSGLRFFEGRPPTLSKNTPPFLLNLFSPRPGGYEEATQAALKKHGKKLANPPTTAKGLQAWIARLYLVASPEDITAIRDRLQRLRSLAVNHPLEIRDQMIRTLTKRLKGTPGPKSKIPSGASDRILESSRKLRPVFEKILDLSKESKQPLPEIVKAASTLNPEWKTECDFLLERMDLVDRSLNLSKIKRAKTRGKASKLSDALACEFTGFHAGPSYSMQILEQARRSKK